MDAADWHSANAERFDSRYAHSTAFNERREVWRRLIEAHMREGRSVLDAGCGSGVLSFIAAERASRVLGIDGGEQMIRLSESRRVERGIGNASFRLMRMEDVATLAPDRFDVVLCSSVLEYMEDFWATFEALTSVLADDGVLIFSLPNMASLYRRLEQAAYSLTGRPEYYGLVRTRLSGAAVKRGLAARGFTPIETRYYAATPVLSAVARPAGLGYVSDNLVAYVCMRAARSGSLEHMANP